VYPLCARLRFLVSTRLRISRGIGKTEEWSPPKKKNKKKRTQNRKKEQKKNVPKSHKNTNTKKNTKKPTKNKKKQKKHPGSSVRKMDIHLQSPGRTFEVPFLAEPSNWRIGKFSPFARDTGLARSPGMGCLMVPSARCTSRPGEKGGDRTFRYIQRWESGDPNLSPPSLAHRPDQPLLIYRSLKRLKETPTG